MSNSTALVLANDKNRKDQMVRHLSATGLFKQIKALSSSSALFRHLKTQSADMVCWTTGETHRKTDWIGKLQAQEQWLDLPLIAFAEDQQGLIEGFQMGASDAVHIQIDTTELSVRMNRHLQRWQRLLELRKSQEHLQKMALTDPLTQLGNRATFDLSIRQAAARTQRTGQPYSLLMIDLDHFKGFNDTHGHQVGDTILTAVAGALRSTSRETDICCRYGGEEFAIILPDTSVQNAAILAGRIHRQVRKVSLTQPRERQPITVSIGISCANRQDRSHPRSIIEEADQALYQAKKNGRNRTEIWGSSPIGPKVRFAPAAVHQLALTAS